MTPARPPQDCLGCHRTVRDGLKVARRTGVLCAGCATRLSRRVIAANEAHLQTLWKLPTFPEGRQRYAGEDELKSRAASLVQQVSADEAGEDVAPVLLELAGALLQMGLVPEALRAAAAALLGATDPRTRQLAVEIVLSPRLTREGPLALNGFLFPS